ncbi:MAG: hypothetical protein HWE39_08030 [Oceanospirillaceae bacterium]|nr:hypothetical protein [Oceanospirillaceae bacterium]
MIGFPRSGEAHDRDSSGFDRLGEWRKNFYFSPKTKKLYQFNYLKFIDNRAFCYLQQTGIASNPDSRCQNSTTELHSPLLPISQGLYINVKHLRQALDVLEERGYLEITETPKDGPGRRPSPTVLVRQVIWEGWQ